MSGNIPGVLVSSLFRGAQIRRRDGQFRLQWYQVGIDVFIIVWSRCRDAGVDGCGFGGALVGKKEGKRRQGGEESGDRHTCERKSTWHYYNVPCEAKTDRK